MGHDSNVYSLPATDGYELMRGLEKIIRYIYNAIINLFQCRIHVLSCYA